MLNITETRRICDAATKASADVHPFSAEMCGKLAIFLLHAIDALPEALDAIEALCELVRRQLDYAGYPGKTNEQIIAAAMDIAAEKAGGEA